MNDEAGVPLASVECPVTGTVETIVTAGPDRLRCTGCDRDVDTWAELLADHTMHEEA